MRPPFLALACATALGAGYIPYAPGTFGSAVGLAIWWVLPPTPAVHALAIVVLFAIGSWSGSVAEHHFGRPDPSQVVLDEVVGMLMTLFLNPVGWVGVVMAFVLFRIADIIKPFPANRFERLPGGFGIMADDAMAAMYANVVLRAVVVVSHRLIA